jgi:hypothetical protein
LYLWHLDQWSIVRKEEKGERRGKGKEEEKKEDNSN